MSSAATYPMNLCTRMVLLLLVGALMAPLPLAAQLPAAARVRETMATRPELEAIASQPAFVPGQTTTDEATRTHRLYEASLARQRLADGDFSPGDRIVLNVAAQETLTDTFTVRAGRRLELPQIGDVPLAGVLRAELTEHMTKHIERFVLSPQVRATALVRVAVMGEVSRPGFYAVPADMPLTDVIMTAGGPAPEADMKRTIIRRGSTRLWDRADVQTALSTGMTLDQIHANAGDEIVVGKRRQRNFVGSLQTLSFVLGTALTIITVTR